LQSSTRVIYIWIAKFPRSLIVRNLTCSCAHHFTVCLAHISLRGAARKIRFIVNCNNHIVLLMCLLLTWRLSIIWVTSFIWPWMLDSNWNRSPTMNRRVIVMSVGIHAGLFQHRDINQSGCFRGVRHLWHNQILGRVKYHLLVLQKVSNHLLLMLQKITQSPSCLRTILSHNLSLFLFLLPTT
jgi:hypothetical protein